MKAQINYIAKILKDNQINLISEYKFLPYRKFRFDYAILEFQIAIEIEGGVYIQGRHTRGSGFIKDMEKYNLATMNNWSLLRYTPTQIIKSPFKIIDDILTTIKNKR